MFADLHCVYNNNTNHPKVRLTFPDEQKTKYSWNTSAAVVLQLLSG